MIIKITPNSFYNPKTNINYNIDFYPNDVKDYFKSVQINAEFCIPYGRNILRHSLATACCAFASSKTQIKIQPEIRFSNNPAGRHRRYHRDHYRPQKHN